MITLRGLRPIRPRPVALLGAVLLIVGGSYLATAVSQTRLPGPVSPQAAASIAPLDVPAPAAGRFQER